MKDRYDQTQANPEPEIFDLAGFEDAFLRAVREEEAERLIAQIDQSVSSLKAAVETPEDRVIRLCAELIEICRAKPSGP